MPAGTNARATAVIETNVVGATGLEPMTPTM